MSITVKQIRKEKAHTQNVNTVCNQFTVCEFNYFGLFTTVQVTVNTNVSLLLKIKTKKTKFNPNSKCWIRA